MNTDPDWPAYLRRFHAERPGITEAAFEHARDPDVGTAYDWLVAALPARPGRVADIGCGSAPLHPRLATADSYVGVDLSAGELALAHQRGRGPVIRADARRLPLPDDSVDTVLSSMGLMLMDPLLDALSEIVRILRPGGTLGVLLPARWPLRVQDLRPLLILAMALRGAGTMPQHLSPGRARRQLEQAGLSVTSTQRRRFPFPLRTTDDAATAVHALYTPRHTPRQLDNAATRLGRRTGTAELPLPLLRVVARLPGQH